MEEIDPPPAGLAAECWARRAGKEPDVAPQLISTTIADPGLREAQEGESEESTFKRRASILLACVLLSTGLIMSCLFFFVTPFLTAGVLAFTFGLRHAVDADHIAAIDNITRRLSINGRRPLSIGLLFSLGHCTVVALMCLLVACGSHYARVHLKEAASIGSILGTVISATVLLTIGLLNMRTAFLLYKDWTNTKTYGGHQHELAGFFMRCCPFLKDVTHPCQMYFVGFLFGLGFDTASEVGLLALAATAHSGVPQYTVLILPLTFAAGMTLIDTANGVFMAWAYGWAMTDATRKLFYNFFLTLTSAVVALIIGLVEALGVLSQELQLHGQFWRWIAYVNDHFEVLGYLVIGIFAISLTTAIAMYKRAFPENQPEVAVREENLQQALLKYIDKIDRGEFIDRSGV